MPVACLCAELWDTRRVNNGAKRRRKERVKTAIDAPLRFVLQLTLYWRKREKRNEAERRKKASAKERGTLEQQSRHTRQRTYTGDIIATERYNSLWLLSFLISEQGKLVNAAAT